MAGSMGKIVMIVAMVSIMGGLCCTWTDKDTETYVGMLWVGSIIGTIIGIALIVFGSLPVCCAILKPQAKIIAVVILIFGLIIMFIPAITGKAVADGAIDKYCDRCAVESSGHAGCTEADRSKGKDDIAAIGIVVAYIWGLGFLCVICGITAMSLGCCIFCKCCKMKEELNMSAPPAGAIQGQVVGQPVSAEPEKAAEATTA